MLYLFRVTAQHNLKYTISPCDLAPFSPPTTFGYSAEKVNAVKQTIHLSFTTLSLPSQVLIFQVFQNSRYLLVYFTLEANLQPTYMFCIQNMSLGVLSILYTPAIPLLAILKLRLWAAQYT